MDIKDPPIYFTVIVLIITTLATGCPCSAQVDFFDEDWRWVHFTTEYGLPSNFVQELVETADGVPWIATSGEVAWYDGYVWNKVGPSLGLPKVGAITKLSAAGNTVFVLIQGIAYKGSTTGFRRIIDQEVEDIAPISNDSLFVIKGEHVYLLTNGTMTPESFGGRPGDNPATRLWRTKSGTIWVNAKNGLSRYFENKWKCVIPADSAFLLVSGDVLVENALGDGLVSIGIPFKKRGMWEWKIKGTAFHNVREKGDRIKSADIDRHGQVIIVHSSGQIRRRANDKWSTIQIRQPEIREIEFLRFRPNGELWIATQRGLFLYKKASRPWTSIRHTLPDPRNDINEIVKTKDGSLWVGTGDGLEIHHRNGTVDYISELLHERLFVVTGLVQDRNDNVWVTSGGSFGGAFVWDGIKWSRFKEGTEFNNIRFHKVKSDSKGRIWFLGIWEKEFRPDSKEPGVYMYDGVRLTHFGKEDGLIGGRVYGFGQTKDGALWFGTERGLTRWKENTWKSWSSDQMKNFGRIFALTPDHDDRVWFSDRNNGVFYVDQKDSIHQLTSKDGLINDAVWDIRVDSDGKLWMGTDGGLCCYENGMWSYFDYRTGLDNTHVWPILPLQDRVYVGTRGSGIAILNIADKQRFNPRIVLDRPGVDGNSAHLLWKVFGYWGDPPPHSLYSRARIDSLPWSNWSIGREYRLDSLESGSHTFHVQAKGAFGDFDLEGVQGSFSIAVPLYKHPLFLVPTIALLASVLGLGVGMWRRKRRHENAIRLSEEKFRAVAETTLSAIFIYDSNRRLLFHNPGAETVTGYSHDELAKVSMMSLIHPDHHDSFDFERGEAETNDTIRRLELKLLTKDGQERWVDYMEGPIRFHQSAAIIGTAFDITDRKSAEDKILANQTQLRSLALELLSTEERERRRMAAFLHDSIGQALAMSKIQLGTLQHLASSREFAKPLSEIRKHIDQSIRNTRSLTFELSPPVLHELGLVPALEWLVENMREQHKLEITFASTKKSTVINSEMRVLLFNAVRELLVNVVKHAHATTVIVAMSCSNGNVRISVEDDGVGFSYSKVSSGKAGGFGLFNVQERLAYLGGCLEISKKKRKGTRITVTAPLRESKIPSDKV